MAEVEVIDTISSVSNIAFTDKDDKETTGIHMGVAKMDMLGLFKQFLYLVVVIIVCILCLCAYVCVESMYSMFYEYL